MFLYKKHKCSCSSHSCNSSHNFNTTFTIPIISASIWLKQCYTGSCIFSKPNRCKHDNRGWWWRKSRTSKQAIRSSHEGFRLWGYAAAEEYLKEADNSLSGEAKMHVGEAIKALQAGDIEGAKMHAQVALGLL